MSYNQIMDYLNRDEEDPVVGSSRALLHIKDHWTSITRITKAQHIM